jgi:hypothetical protein
LPAWVATILKQLVAFSNALVLFMRDELFDARTSLMEHFDAKIDFLRKSATSQQMYGALAAICNQIEENCGRLLRILYVLEDEIRTVE